MRQGGCRESIAAQKSELAMLDAVSRQRRLTQAETDRLAELVRRERVRQYFRGRRLAQHLARAEARLAQLRATAPMAVAA